MRRAFTLITALALLTITLPSGVSAAEDPVHAWLDEHARAAGHDAFDVNGLEIERRSVNALGVVTTTTLTGEAALAHFVASHGARLVDVDAPRSGPGVQDAVLGSVTHLMIQVGQCAGYDVRVLLGNVTRVRGSWDVGIHVSTPVAATVAGLTSGQLIPPGVDAEGGAEGLVTPVFHGDTSLWGVGQLTSLTEDRLYLFGSCFALVGTLAGTGAWLFDGLALDMPAEPAALTA